MRPDSNRQSPIALGMRCVSEITTASLLLALPTAGGWWVDGQLGSDPWLMIVGGMFGFGLFFQHLFQLVNVLTKPPRS